MDFASSGARFCAGERLFHQKDRTRSFDFARNFPVKVGRHTGDAPWENLTAFGNEFSEKVWIFVIDGFRRDIDATSGHSPIRAPKIRSTLCVFWFHWSLHLPMEGTPPQERIVLFLLETAGSIRAFFVARTDVAGSRLALSLRLRALKSNDIPWHDS
jgi:hypothetical protein